MCLIVDCRKVDKLDSIQTAFLRNAFSCNPDGWSIFDINDSRVYKGLTYDEFKNYWSYVPNSITFYRRRTSGIVHTDLISPFVVNGVYVWHNGSTRNKPRKDNVSDSLLFANLIGNLPVDKLFNKEFDEEIYSILGNSRVLIGTYIERKFHVVKYGNYSWSNHCNLLVSNHYTHYNYKVHE